MRTRRMLWRVALGVAVVTGGVTASSVVFA